MWRWFPLILSTQLELKSINSYTLFENLLTGYIQHIPCGSHIYSDTITDRMGMDTNCYSAMGGKRQSKLVGEERSEYSRHHGSCSTFIHHPHPTTSHMSSYAFTHILVISDSSYKMFLGSFRPFMPTPSCHLSFFLLGNWVFTYL